MLEVEPGALDLDRFERLRDEARERPTTQCERPALLREALDALARHTARTSSTASRSRRLRGRAAGGAAARRARGAHRRRSGARPPCRARAGARRARRSSTPTASASAEQLMLALYRSGRQARRPRCVPRRAARRSTTGLGLEPGAGAQGARACRARAGSVARRAASHRAGPDDTTTRAASARPTTPRWGSWRSSPRSRSRSSRSSPSRGTTGRASLCRRTRWPSSTLRRTTWSRRSRSGSDPGRSPLVTALSGSATSTTGTSRESMRDRSGRPGRSRSTDALRRGSTFDRGTVWVAHGLLGSVSLVDAQFGNVASVTPVTRRGVYSSAGSVAAGAGAIWAAFGDATLARLDRATGDVAERTTTDGSPVGVTAGYGSVWIASAFQSSVQRFSPLSLAAVDRSTVSSRPRAIVAGFGDVWVTSAGADLVSSDRYRRGIDQGDDRSRRRAERDRGRRRFGLGREQSLGNRLPHRSRDEHRDREKIEVGQAPAGLVAAGNLIWVTVQER